MNAHDRTASLMTPVKLAQAARQQPLSSSAFLDRMAADVGHQHVRRLQDLRAQLALQVAQAQAASLQPALQHLGDALAGLDFSLLQSKGLWASVTGRSKAGGAEFASRYEALEDAAEGLAARAGEARKLQPGAGPADRMLVEFEVEYRALEKIVEQGARWLHDMRDQLKERQAKAGVDAGAREQIRLDVERCETLVRRLKVLRAASATAAQSHQEAKAADDQRATLLAAVQKVLSGNVREWRTRLAPLVDAAVAGSVSGLNLEGPREVQAELGRRVQALLETGTQLGGREQALQALLNTLGDQLSSAA